MVKRAQGIVALAALAAIGAVAAFSPQEEDPEKIAHDKAVRVCTHAQQTHHVVGTFDIAQCISWNTVYQEDDDIPTHH